MRILAATIFAVAMLAAPTAFAGDTDDTAPPAALDDAAFDAAFQCPEAIADRDDRLDEILRYQAWAGAQHPEWNLRKRLDVRYGLLRRHACQVTLANVAASARPPFAR